MKKFRCENNEHEKTIKQWFIYIISSCFDRICPECGGWKNDECFVCNTCWNDNAM